MVLDRKMFRRPSAMPPKKGPSSKGVGITSGLTQPVQNFSNGGYAEKYEEYYKEFLPLAQKISPQESYLDRNAPALLNFFAALGTPVAPGQTVLGKIGEAGAQLAALKPAEKKAETLASSLALEFATKEEDDPTVNVQRIEDPETGKIKIIGFNKTTGEKMWEKFEKVTPTPEDDKDAEDYKLAEDNIINEWAAFRERTGQTALPDLSPEQVDRAIANVGKEGWLKTVPGRDKPLNELYEFFEQSIIPEIDAIEGAETSGTETVTNDQLEQVPLDPKYNPIIVARYDLDPNSYNFDDDYAAKVIEYNKLPEMSSEDADAFNKSFESLRKLKIINDNAESAIPLVGDQVAFLAKTFGFNQGLADFAIASDGLDLTAVDLLIKGVPSNIDLAKVTAITPKAGEAPSTARLKVQRLNEFFGQAILDKIAFLSGMDKKVPEQLLLDAREVLGNAAVDAALGNKYSEERKLDLMRMSREEYIQKYGDPLDSSINLLNKKVMVESIMSDEELDKELNDLIQSLELN